MRETDIVNNLQNAQRELKQSKKKDYYKILEVPRTATEDDIKKVWRLDPFAVSIVHSLQIVLGVPQARPVVSPR